jgi:transposase
MNKIYRVTLTAEERQELEGLIHKGKGAARTLTRARILLKADATPKQGPAWSDAQIRTALDVGLVTIYRVRQSFVEEGLPLTLKPRSRNRRYDRLLDGDQEAHLIALACSAPPAGRARWTLRLLAERFIALGHATDVSHETVRQTLKKTSSSRIW